MEISQKVVKEIADKDDKQITALVTSLQNLIKILNASYDVMQDFSNLAEQYKAPNIITEDIIQVSCTKLGKWSFVMLFPC